MIEMIQLLRINACPPNQSNGCGRYQGWSPRRSEPGCHWSRRSPGCLLGRFGSTSDPTSVAQPFPFADALSLSRIAAPAEGNPRAGNPFDVHLLTGVGARRWLLAQPEIPRAAVAVSLLQVRQWPAARSWLPVAHCTCRPSVYCFGQRISVSRSLGAALQWGAGFEVQQLHSGGYSHWRDCHFCCRSLFVATETPTEGGGGCSRMTVTPTARRLLRQRELWGCRDPSPRPGARFRPLRRRPHSCVHFCGHNCA